MKDKNIEYKSITINHDTYKTLYTKKYMNRKQWEKPDIKKVLAYIPGTVQKLYVKNRQKVNEGDKLLLLEAMKMRNIIIAPVTGKIKKVHVKEGNTVAKNVCMVEFE